MSMLDLSTLNPPQREAVQTIEGPLLVLAGAGSGKTRVIVHRIAYMIEQGIPASSILAVTFTNKAATEMRERVTALVGLPSTKAPTVSTFHAFGCELLRRFIDRLGYPKQFAIADTGDQIAILKRLLHEEKIDEKSLDVRKVLARISNAKGSNHLHSSWAPSKPPHEEPAVSGKSKQTPRLRFSQPLCARAPLAAHEVKLCSDFSTYLSSAYLSKEIDAEALLAKRLLPRYQRALRAQGMVDFDDLIQLPIELFERHEDVCQKLRERYRYLLVDEYQDTNRSQLRFLILLAGERRNVCAVGDDDQSIYSWRGAEVDNILSFDRHFSGGHEVRLEQNYRSSKTILDAANAVITHNEARKQKHLWTAHERGMPIQLRACETEREEALFVASEIRVRIDGGAKPGDIAVLYRTNLQARALEEGLREFDLPYEIVGGQSFFDRKEIKDLIAYLKLCNNPADDVSLLRILNTPSRGIGEATVECITRAARQQNSTITDAMALAGTMVDLPQGALPRLQGFLDLLTRHREAFRRGESLESVTSHLVEEVGLRQAARQSVQSTQAGNNKVRAIDAFIDSIASYSQRHTEMEHAPTLAGLLHKLALDRNEDDVGLSANAIHLMTLHAAKGLEWPCVFICGMEEGLMPHSGMNGEPQNLQEERRLAYVGITRAKETLFLTRAEKRSHQGKVTERQTSRFLDDIPEPLCEQVQSSQTLSELSQKSVDFFGTLQRKLRERP